MSCEKCRSKTLVRDDTTGNLVCADCGALQPFDNYDAQLGGLQGPQGTIVRVGSAGAGVALNYREKKLYEAHKSIEDLVSKLNLVSKFSDIKQMVSDVTEGEFGQGDWFSVLVGACSYAVMRIDNRNCIPMEEVCTVVGCDLYELGSMIRRVVEQLELQLPEFDLLASFERVLRNSMILSKLQRDKKSRIKKQGLFLMNCSVKWFLSTGRRPIPLIVAVLVLVSEMNGISVRIEELAKELQVPTSTCKSRYKELLENLVKVAREVGLPWVKDVNVKNIVNHGPVLIGIMEAKSMENKEKIDAIETEVAGNGFDLVDVLNECLNGETEYQHFDSKYLETENNYYEIEDSNGLRTLEHRKPENLNVSYECLSLMYKSFCVEVDRNKCLSLNTGQRRRRLELPGFREWWSGMSDLSKRLVLKQLLEKDVGLETLPPSFIKGCEALERRREKIKAAQLRIGDVMHPSKVGGAGKRRKQTIDWEDLIIETLLLHRVKEEEIEKGYYNTLLDLHVFGSGAM